MTIPAMLLKRPLTLQRGDLLGPPHAAVPVEVQDEHRTPALPGAHGTDRQLAHTVAVQVAKLKAAEEEEQEQEQEWGGGK